MKKIKVLALVMVLAFAALGGAYAMWFDELYVDATAKTGIVDLEWKDLHLVDADPNYEGLDGDVYGTKHGDGLDTLDEFNPNDNKNIGSLTAVIKKVDRQQGTGDQDIVSRLDKLQVVLKNGYPGYQEFIDVKIRNAGTVPVKLEAIQGLDNVPEWLIVDLRNPSNPNDDSFDLTSYQLDPGEEKPIWIVFRVKEELEEGICPQNASASFTLTLKGVQWNEYGWDLEDKIQFPRKDNYPYPPTQPQS